MIPIPIPILINEVRTGIRVLSEKSLCRARVPCFPIKIDDGLSRQQGLRLRECNSAWLGCIRAVGFLCVTR